ncbi:MAG: hypothetical protein IKM26_05440 [Clostridia bacterium]|nr:hypothetical protein [Clostridia bacterium]MBR6787343.1 hypothetical protein [Clostridia bacterium]
MNLRRRTRKPVYIARPQPIQGGMGAVHEAFAAPHQALEGLILPSAASLKPHAAGLHQKATCTLLLPPSADILPGDGVGLAPDNLRYRVTRCDRYPLHLCAHLEERQV